MSLFSKLTPQAEAIINANIDLVNANIEKWIKQERRPLNTNLPEQALVYLAVAKRRKYSGQQELKLTPQRKSDIVKLAKQGYTIEQVKRVVDYKVEQWWGGEMHANLRPETLFGGKFTSYLEQANEAHLVVKNPIQKPEEGIKINKLHSFND